jgi:hypothetical protein
MYNVNFICTYVFYDETLIYLNPISKKYIYDKTHGSRLNKNQQYNNLQDDNDFDENFIEDDNKILDIEELIHSEDSKILSDKLYREELLFAFQLDKYEDLVINTKITGLYNYIQNNLSNPQDKIDFEDCLKVATTKYFQMGNIDLELGFVLLFSYNYFHIMHLCLIDFFKDGSFSKNNMDTLKNCLK